MLTFLFPFITGLKHDFSMHKHLPGQEGSVKTEVTDFSKEQSKCLYIAISCLIDIIA